MSDITLTGARPGSVITFTRQGADSVVIDRKRQVAFTTNEWQLQLFRNGAIRFKTNETENGADLELKEYSPPAFSFFSHLHDSFMAHNQEHNLGKELDRASLAQLEQTIDEFDLDIKQSRDRGR